MSDIFFWTGIVFIIEAIRGSIMASNEISEYKTELKIPGNIEEAEAAKDSIKAMLGELKKKALPSIIGLFVLSWNIIGIFWTDAWVLFISNIATIFIGSVVVGFVDKTKKIPVIVLFNIISISIMSYILYLNL